MATDQDIDRTIASLVEVSAEIETAAEMEEPQGDLMLQAARLTSELVRQKVASGGLTEHPYEHIRRNSPATDPAVAEYLENRCILVTGGGGLVGGALARRIVQEQKLHPKHMLLLDRNSGSLIRATNQLQSLTDRLQITPVHGDIGDEELLRKLFQVHHPQVVFHLAAQRSPKASEDFVRDAIATNMHGSQLLCAFAIEFEVERFIHASTGKCRFFYDNRVYPATKKLAEIVLRICADDSNTRCSLVRFHHVINNSIAEQTFRGQVRRGEPMTVHLPSDRSKHGQSIQEAVTMLLHGGIHGRRAEIYGSNRQMDYFSVLDLALYQIKDSGRQVPVLFATPKRSQGYERSEFAGIRLASVHDPKRLTHSLNLVETENCAELPRLGLVTAPFPPFDRSVARNAIREVVNTAHDGNASDDELKKCLTGNLRKVAVDLYSQAPPHLLATALRQGVNEDTLLAHDLADHLPTIRILLDALGSDERIAKLDAPQKATCSASLKYLREIAPPPDQLDNLIDAIDTCMRLL